MTPRKAAIVLFLVFGAGCLAGQAPLRVELAELRQARAEDDRLTARSDWQRLQAAQARGDELTAQLAKAQLQIDQTTQEKRDALKSSTDGRACLGPAAVRVLDGAVGIRIARLPEATGIAAAADGAIASIGVDADRWVSDLALSSWALDAGAQYEQCRQRLAALIDWWAPQADDTRPEK